MVDAGKTEVKLPLMERPETPFQKLLCYACALRGISSWYQLHQVCVTTYTATQTWTLQGVLRWRDRESLPDDYRLLCIADLAEVSMEYALLCRGASASYSTPAAIQAWSRLEDLVLEADLATPDWERYNEIMGVEA